MKGNDVNYFLLNGKKHRIIGKSAYDIAVDNGFEGTEAEWLDSMAKEATEMAENYANQAIDSATKASEDADRTEAERAKAEEARSEAEAERAKAEEARIQAESHTSEQIEKWLDDHPEATTTVQDESLVDTKFTEELKLQTIKDYVTPQMFGAKGDGVTDDTEAIRRAIAYLGDSGTLFFPSGSYLISKSIATETAITLKGEGIDISNICAAKNGSYSDYLINFLKPSSGGGICDLTVTNSDASIHESLSGIIIGSGKSSVASAFKCHHVKIKQFVNGLKWHTDWQAYFDHIYIINCSDIGFIIAGSDTQFSNINISKCKCGMQINGGTTKITNLKIDNCNTGSVDNYALRVYGAGNQIVNGEVQYCYPSGVIVTSPQNQLDLRIDGIGMDANAVAQPNGGYFLTFISNAKYGIYRIFMYGRKNEIKGYINDPSNLIYSQNSFKCVSNVEIPLWYAKSKMPTTEITSNAFVLNDLATLKTNNHVQSSTANGQFDLRLLTSFFPNADTDVHTSVLKIVTDKEIQIPFYYYSNSYGKNNKSIKLHQTYIDGKYTTYYLNYSEKDTTSVNALVVKSADGAAMNVYDVKALFYGENISVDYAKNVMFTL